MQMVHDGKHDLLVEALMDEYLSAQAVVEPMNDERKDVLMSNIFAASPEISETKRSRPAMFSMKLIYAAAAIVLLVGSFAMYLMLQQRSPEIKYSNYTGTIAPGADIAVLTLADGKKVTLPEIGVGKVLPQGGLLIKKTNTGLVVYQQDPGASAAIAQAGSPVQYNMITTPAGGKYQLVLADGTHVWLNSSSSLRYPVTGFASGERRVELSGEAYFEVAKRSNGKKHVPFIVASKGQEVEVLGTHFNVKSYNDEQLTTTTLLEGRVKVSRQNAFEQVLQPGQQAQVNQSIKVINVDTSTAVAWKNGLFKFENASIQDVMLQFSRWYNVDVAFEGKIPRNRFTGEIYRNMDADKTFKILTYANIKFRIEAPADKGLRKRIVVFSK